MPVNLLRYAATPLLNLPQVGLRRFEAASLGGLALYLQGLTVSRYEIW